MKIFKGTILKKNGEKTAVVAVNRVMIHPVYKKRVKRTKKYHVHDESGKSEAGQKVMFAASKPYSKTKKWKLFENGNDKKKTNNEVTQKKTEKKERGKSK